MWHGLWLVLPKGGEGASRSHSQGVKTQDAERPTTWQPCTSHFASHCVHPKHHAPNHLDLDTLRVGQHVPTAPDLLVSTCLPRCLTRLRITKACKPGRRRVSPWHNVPLLGTVATVEVLMHHPMMGCNRPGASGTQRGSLKVPYNCNLPPLQQTQPQALTSNAVHEHASSDQAHHVKAIPCLRAVLSAQTTVPQHAQYALPSL